MTTSLFMRMLAVLSLSTMIVLSCPEAKASSVTLAWDPPTNNYDGTPVTDLAGYKVYYGLASRAYSNCIDVGLVTTTTVTSLPTGTSTFFAATAYNTSSNESEFSDELVVPIPPVPGMTTVKSCTYSIQQGKVTIAFSVAQVTETGGNLTNAVSLLVKTVNSSGSLTNFASVAVAPHPAATVTVVVMIPANSGPWSACAAVSNSYGQVAPWGTAVFFGTSLPVKPGKPRVVQCQF